MNAQAQYGRLDSLFNDGITSKQDHEAGKSNHGCSQLHRWLRTRLWLTSRSKRFSQHRIKSR